MRFNAFTRFFKNSVALICIHVKQNTIAIITFKFFNENNNFSGFQEILSKCFRNKEFQNKEALKP